MFSKLFGKKPTELPTPLIPDIQLPEDQQEMLDNDVSILDGDAGANSERLENDAKKTVINAAENSIKQMHVVRLGRCPVCGEHLYQHMAASVCPSCGWNKYDLPRTGKVKIHLRNNGGIVEGEKAYVLKDNTCLVMSGDVVIAKVPNNAYDWVEYVWPQEELIQRRQQANGKLRVICGWCNQETDPSKDGFHLVHVAFGSSQERHCFCSDECLEAFRKMYPSRVHRNCYERNCSECNLCYKRYGGEAEEMRLLAKDYIRITKKSDEPGK